MKINIDKYPLYREMTLAQLGRLDAIHADTQLSNEQKTEAFAAEFSFT